MIASDLVNHEIGRLPSNLSLCTTVAKRFGEARQVTGFPNLPGDFRDEMLQIVAINAAFVSGAEAHPLSPIL